MHPTELDLPTDLAELTRLKDELDAWEASHGRAHDIVEAIAAERAWIPPGLHVRITLTPDQKDRWDVAERLRSHPIVLDISSRYMSRNFMQLDYHSGIYCFVAAIRGLHARVLCRLLAYYS